MSRCDVPLVPRFANAQVLGRCTTTPVVRRKPVRKGQQDPPVDTNNESASPDANQQPPATFGLLPTFRADASTSQGGSPDSFALITGSRPLALDELPSELIIDLFESEFGPVLRGAQRLTSLEQPSVDCLSATTLSCNIPS